MKSIWIVLLGFLTYGCGGGTNANSQDQMAAAMAEAMGDLELAKIATTKAYRENSNSFPAADIPAVDPFPLRAHMTDQYIWSLNYKRGSATTASIVVRLRDTGNEIMDSSYFGMFGTGQVDGTVDWACGTAVSPDSTASAARAAMYPYLPVACQR